MLLIKSQIVHTCNDPNWQSFNLRYYQIGVATGYHFPEYDCTINPADVEIETSDEYEGSSENYEHYYDYENHPNAIFEDEDER